ncbi:MAG: amino acid adenylation domain-containing protein [Jatrophihabitans sp.]
MSRRRQATPTSVISRADRSQPLALSCGQERFWLVNRFTQGGPMAEAGNCAFWFRLTGQLELPALRSAVAALHERHEILRTVIGARPAGIQQITQPAGPVPVPIEQLADAEAALRRARELAAEPFDLATDLPVRWNVLSLTDTDNVLLLRIHHIACDGWSESVMFAELAQLYSDLAAGRQPVLPPLELQYADYARWQRDQLASGRLAGQLDYFRAALAGAPAVTVLPGDAAAGESQLAPGAVRQLVLSRAAEQAAQRLCGSHSATLFMVLLSAYSALLHRYSGQTDLVVGAPVAGRNHPQLAGLIGFFVNTVPIRIELSGDPSFEELLRRVREAALGALANQDVPFEVLIESLALPRVPGRPPLVQTMLQVHNTPAAHFDFAGLQAELRQLFTASAALDLTASFLTGDGSLQALWEYRVDLFEGAEIEQLHRELEQLLVHAGTAPTTRISELRLLDDQQLQAIRRWSTGPSRDLAVANVVELFDATAGRTPDAPAIVDGHQLVSYAELDRRSNQLARQLIDVAVQPDQLVGICLPRGKDAVIAILAVLKAGAGYLPIDPDYPAARRQFMVDDAGLSAILSSGDRLADLKLGSLPAICLDRAAELVGGQPTDRLARPIEPGAQAYVIYTSGSTGRPKGAAIDHRGLLNYTRWAAGHYGGQRAGGGIDAVLHSSLSFDLTVTSVFVPLATGGCVRVLADRQPLPALDGMLSDPEVELGLLKLTPAHLRSLLPLHRAASQLATVHSFVIGGEALASELTARWQQLLPRSNFFNEYGPTETVVGCAVHRFDPAAQSAAYQPIGTPIDNTQLHVLDRYGNQLAAGQVGELYIGGDGVCRGYPGRPALTASRFVPDHLGRRAGARLYRTGDLASWDESGVLHFHGRVDDQVKLNGYRIELAEIDSAIRSCAGVADAVTTFGRDPDRLMGYYTCSVGQQLEPSDLRTELAALLPAEVLPDLLQRLDRLPLTANGKLDRAALPEPTGWQPAAQPYLAPSNLVETTVCRIWAQVLGHDQVGLDDNFFVLGGHSMQAATVAAELSASWPLLPGARLLRAIFAGPTVRQLSAQVLELMCRACSAPTPYQPAPVDEVELSDVKRGLFFLQQLNPTSTEFLVPIAVELRGPCDHDALLSALRQLTARHRALRARFELTDSGPRQVDGPPALLPVREDDLRGLPETASGAAVQRILAEELGTPIDIVNGPLVRARVSRIASDRLLLLLITHHIATDAQANLALLTDLGQLYDGGPASSATPAVSELAPRYPIDPAVREDDLRYWQDHLAGLPELQVPTDRARPDQRSGRGSTIEFVLGPTLAAGIARLAGEQATTDFTVLLAAVATLIWRRSGQDDFALGTSSVLGAGSQPAGVVDISIDQVALRMDLSGGPSFVELVARTRERCQRSLSHVGVSFLDVVQAVAPARDLSRTPLFQVAVELALGELPPDLFPGLQLVEVAVPVSVAKYDLSFIFGKQSDGIAALLEYSSDLFEPRTARSMADELLALIQLLVSQPELPISQLPLRPGPGDDAEQGAEQPVAERAEAEPEPELAGLLGQAWAELLGISEVGLDQDFFQLGGDSLLALRLTSKLRRMLDSSDLPLELVFRFPTVRLLATELERRLLSEIDQLSDQEVIDALGPP